MTALVASVALNMNSAGSLSQVWGLVNGQQIIVHQPLHAKLMFPTNAMRFATIML